MTPVAPIHGFTSIQCAGQRHGACRPNEWACGCTCHNGVADAASTASASVCGEVCAAGVVDGTAAVESTAPRGLSVNDEADPSGRLTVAASTGRPTPNKAVAEDSESSATELRAG